MNIDFFPLEAIKFGGWAVVHMERIGGSSSFQGLSRGLLSPLVSEQIRPFQALNLVGLPDTWMVFHVFR